MILKTILFSFLVASITSCKIEPDSVKESKTESKSERQFQEIRTLNSVEKNIAHRLCTAINSKNFNFFPRYNNSTFRFSLKTKTCLTQNYAEEIVDTKLVQKNYESLGPNDTQHISQAIDSNFDLKSICIPLLSNPNNTITNTIGQNIQTSFYTSSNGNSFARLSYFSKNAEQSMVLSKIHTISLITDADDSDIAHHGAEQFQSVALPCKNGELGAITEQKLIDF